MNDRTRRCIVWNIVILAVSAGILGCSPEPEFTCRDAIDPSTFETESFGNGIRVRTEHFDLRVTAQDEVIREYLAPFLEATYCEYEKLVPPPQPLGKRLVVYLFNTRDEWAQFTKQRFPLQASTYLYILSGGYTDSASATAVAFDLQRDHTLSLLAHEGMHQYFSRCFPRRIPAWLNEGLACQWEAFELEGPYPVFTPKRNFNRRNHLREALSQENGLIPLRQLLQIDAGVAVREADVSVRTYYAQVWSLVLYLQSGDDGKYTAPFRQLLADLGTNAVREKVNAYLAAHPEASDESEGMQLFKAYLTVDLDTFAFDYRSYARRLVD